MPDRDAPGADRSIFGVPRAAAAETLLVFAAALIFDAVVLHGTRFRDISPHPFWLWSLVVAAQYGTATGVFASVLGILLAFTGNLPQPDPLQDHSTYLLAVLGKPVVWFATAVVLGELQMRRERGKNALQSHVDEPHTQMGALTVANANLETAAERLRTTAAGQVQTTVALFEAAKTVETQHTGSVFASVDSLIQSILTPTSYSIYLKSDDHLDLVVHSHDGKQADALQRYDRGSKLYHAIVMDKQVVHVAAAQGQEILGKDGVLAGPLMDTESGMALGMLKVENLPMPMLRAESLAAFRALCEWIGSAYRKAQRFEEANKSRVTAPGSQLFSDAFYQSVSTFLVALAERARFEVSRLTIRVSMDPQPLEAIPPQVHKIVEDVVTRGLRTTDLAFDYWQVRGEYYVLLPMTPSTNCQVVSDRLRERIVNQVHEKGYEVRVAITYESLYVPTPDDVKPWHRPIFRRTAPYGIQ